MINALYEGIVTHRRTAPRAHAFSYQVTYYFLELDKNHDQVLLPFLLSFNPKNYLKRDDILGIIRQHGNFAVEKVFILTQLSYLGFCFNPVSFYYCYDSEGKLAHIISQITNTPWGEKKINYFQVSDHHTEFNFAKDFHVSPFMPMNIDYCWKFNAPAETISIAMDNRELHAQADFFHASMSLSRKALNRANVIKNFFTFPLISFKTIVGIYWQALVLYLKRVPFHPHPKTREVT